MPLLSLPDVMYAYCNIFSNMRKLGIPLGPPAYTVILVQMVRLVTAAVHKTDDAAGMPEAITKAIARTRTTRPSDA